MLPAHHIDTLLGFAIPGRDARGRLVRVGPVLDAVLAAHGYPPPIEKLLAEALALTALLGATLKDPAGQMTLQAQTTGGIVTLLVCDYRGGELRGYARHDAGRLGELPARPALRDIFGEAGHLAITFDQMASKERYQGIVPLEGASLAAAAENFFRQSEQIPSLVRLATHHGPSGCVAGGLLLQHLPEGEEGRERLHTRLDHPEWEHVRMLGDTIRAEELTNPALALETLIWRLFNEEDEVRLLGEADLAKGCRCDPGHIGGVIRQFSEEERREMADADGVIRVDCAFCGRLFPIPLEAVDG